MSHTSSSLNFEPADPWNPASSAGTSSVFPLPAHASPTSTLGVPGSYAEFAIDHTSGSRPSEMAATLLPQPVIDLVAWLRNRYLPQDLAVPEPWNQQLAVLTDRIMLIDDLEAKVAFALFLDGIRDRDSSDTSAHEVKEQATQKLFQVALSHQSRLANAGRDTAGRTPSALQDPASRSKRRRQQYSSPETSVVQQPFSVMERPDTMYLSSPASSKRSAMDVITSSAMGSAPASWSPETYEEHRYVSADMSHLRYSTVANQALVVPDYNNARSSVLYGFQSEVADTRPRESLLHEGETDQVKCDYRLSG
jgi:hypothetical protein